MCGAAVPAVESGEPFGNFAREIGPVLVRIQRLAGAGPQHGADIVAIGSGQHQIADERTAGFEHRQAQLAGGDP